MSDDKATVKQIAFIKELTDRLTADECPSRIQADAIRIRRELNTLVKMQNWDERYKRMK